MWLKMIERRRCGSSSKTSSSRHRANSLQPLTAADGTQCRHSKSASSLGYSQTTSRHANGNHYIRAARCQPTRTAEDCPPALGAAGALPQRLLVVQRKGAAVPRRDGHRVSLDPRQFDRDGRVRDALSVVSIDEPAATVPVLLHKGRPIYDSAEQIQYIDKYLTGPSNSLIPPGHADEVREWVNFTSVDCVHDFNELDTHQRMGCCVPGCTLPMFAALLRETRLSNIAWGIGKHPVKIRPPIMCLLKLIGPYLIIILPKMRRVVQDARDAMRVHLQGIDELLSDGRPYLVGDTFTLADVSLMVVFERLDVGGFADTLFGLESCREVLG